MIKKTSVSTLLNCGLLLLSSCGQTQPFSNLSFETGDYREWQMVGNAFSVTDSSTYSDNRRFYLPDGRYHLLGSNENTGTLTSPYFKVTNSGYISFLLSHADDQEKTYVRIIDEKKRELVKLYNEYYYPPFQTDTYVRFNVDLSDYMGQKVAVQLVDQSPSSSLNFDGLVIDISEAKLIDYLDDTNVRLGIARAHDMKEAADIYTKLNAWKVDDDKRFTYHLSGQIGWMNDPNGFSYYQDKIHLFYQHNPYSTNWGPMHWGHATSEDFVKWTHENTALAPDQEYDAVGAFSGSAITLDDTYYLLYTGASHDGQVQALASSSDGLQFTKHPNNPVINASHLPANASSADFRDPKLFKRGEWIYAIIAARNTNSIYSSLLLYKTKDMSTWQYAGRTFSNGAPYADTLGIMLECPDLIQVDGQDLIIVSPQTVTNHRNSDGNVYIKGTMNWQTGVLENVDYQTIREIDHGFDFYAPTTMVHPDGRTIMVAWMAGWSRTPVTSEFGYAGVQTFPRQLNYVNDELIQTPVEELSHYYQNSLNFSQLATADYHYLPQLEGRVKDVSLEFSPTNGQTGISVFDDGEGHGVKVYYQDGYVYLDRSQLNNGYFPSEEKHNVTRVAAPLVEGKVKLRLLLDKYSLEVFVSDGRGVMTATVMTNTTDQQMAVYSNENTTLTFVSHDIVV